MTVWHNVVCHKAPTKLFSAHCSSQSVSQSGNAVRAGAAAAAYNFSTTCMPAGSRLSKCSSIRPCAADPLLFGWVILFSSIGVADLQLADAAGSQASASFVAGPQAGDVEVGIVFSTLGTASGPGETASQSAGLLVVLFSGPRRVDYLLRARPPRATT